MATKLQKIDAHRGKQASTIAYNLNEGKIRPINQTIIINNANININYMNDTARVFPANAYSSKGLDTWDLNHNLKEFSETRQLGFYQGKKQKDKIGLNPRLKSNSPYIIHKVRTQDIRSINKLYGQKSDQPLSGRKGIDLGTLEKAFKNPKEIVTARQKISTRENQNLNKQISNSKEQIDQKNRHEEQMQALEKIISKHDKSVTKKMYNGHLKKHARQIESQRHLQNFNTTFMNILRQNNPEQSKGAIRRNRFELIPDPSDVKKETENSIRQLDYDFKKQNKEQSQSEEQSISMQSKSKALAPRKLQFEMRRRNFIKTIDNINKGLLSKTDDYFDKMHGEVITQSNIQYYVNGLNQPDYNEIPKQRSLFNNQIEWGEYDFHFQEDKSKKRPKTPPKRKKIYDATE